MNDVVSIILTTFKRPELLNRSLRSALSQSYNNLEVIVVDDNDPNSVERKMTGELIKTEFSAYKNLNYVLMSHNSGACAARNYGVSISKGKYINFLDDDDEMRPDKIEKQVRLFEADKDEKLAAVGCYGEVVDEHGNHISDIKDDVKGDVFFHNLCYIVGITSQILLRRDTYIKSGGFEKMYSSQDHWMLIRLFSVSPYYDYVAEPLVKIYHHSGTRISTNNNKPLGAVELYKKCEAFYDRLTPAQVIKLKKIRNEHIISAFLHQNRMKESLRYWKKGIKDRSKCDIYDIRRLINILLGEKSFRRIVVLLSKLKHKILS